MVPGVSLGFTDRGTTLTAPTVVTIGRDYGSANKAQGIKSDINLIQFPIPHSKFRIQIHLPIETRKQVLILRNNILIPDPLAEIVLLFITH